MLSGDEFYDDDVTSGVIDPPKLCRDCRGHYRGECPEGWPASERSPVRPRRSRVAGCSTCARDPEGRQLMPPHDASSRCESGKHSHCSCDTCF